MSRTAQHILIIFHDFSAGGTEIIALKLAQDWVKSGRLVTILCGTLDGPLWDQVPVGVRVQALSPEIGRSLFSRIALRRAVAKAVDSIRPDLVFLPGNFHLVLAGGLRKAATVRPVVAKISNPIDSGSVALVRYVTNLAFRIVARDADWLVAMSSGLLKDTVAATKSHAASVIFDPNVAAKGANTPCRLAPDPSGTIRLLAAGRLAPQKDFALAIRVTAELARTRDVHLTIVGEGPKRKSLEALADRLGVADRVTMPGHVPSIVPALSDAQLLLVTSRYEGGPAVAVEALEQGVPVIATDCSHFLRDLLAQPGCGKIVESRDAREIAGAIETFLKPGTRQHFTPSVVTSRYRDGVAAGNYLKLFDSLVREPSQTAQERRLALG